MKDRRLLVGDAATVTLLGTAPNRYSVLLCEEFFAMGWATSICSSSIRFEGNTVSSSILLMLKLQDVWP